MSIHLRFGVAAAALALTSMGPSQAASARNYAAGMIGMASGDAHSDFGPFGSAGTDLGDGVSVSATLGYALSEGAFKYGVEGDLAWTDLSEDIGFGSLNFTTYSASARGFLGIELFDGLTAYATGGLVASFVDAPAYAQDGEALFGLAYGAGIDLELTDNVSARVEYRMNDYFSAETTGVIVNADTEYDIDVISVGLTFGL